MCLNLRDVRKLRVCIMAWIREVFLSDCHGSKYDKNGNILDNPTIPRIDI